jgi:hypothetical protein
MSKNRLWVRVSSIAVALVLAGCTAMTSITVTQPNATVAIAGYKNTATPRTETVPTTSFGNFEFRADAPGYETFYGILPLKFNGGYLALDILFFAPAAFFNLREVYPQYDFDLEKKQVRYRTKSEEEWSVFVPLKADEDQGRQAFAKTPAQTDSKPAANPGATTSKP